LHQFGAGTHIGQRDNNEDSYVCDEDKELWIVADGMGGLGFGEAASAISTYTVETQVKEGHGVNQAIELAHQRIKEYAESEGMGVSMGTTLVLLLSQGSLYNVFWVGDSRAYLYDGNLIQLTVDHSLVQVLIDEGKLTEKEASFDPRKNAVTRALGIKQIETIRADSVSDKWRSNQKILLCSDGLTDCISDEEIKSIIDEGASDQETVDKLINAAVDCGGKDNITIILVSAPKSLQRPDTDTHIPGETNDSTYVPESDTQRRNKSPDSSLQKNLDINNKPEQLEIELLDNEVRKSDKQAKPGKSISLFFLDWQKYLVAATLIFTMVLLARLTTADKQEMPSNLFGAGKLGLQEIQAGIPMTRGKIPDVDLPLPGQVIQVGIFSRLEGAETRQRDLSKIGLIPFIEKQSDHNGVLYAVLLGPFHNPADKQLAITTLKNRSLSYYERREVRY